MKAGEPEISREFSEPSTSAVQPPAAHVDYNNAAGKVDITTFKPTFVPRSERQKTKEKEKKDKGKDRSDRDRERKKKKGKSTLVSFEVDEEGGDEGMSKDRSKEKTGEKRRKKRKEDRAEANDYDDDSIEVQPRRWAL
ncbi:hypothetical protein DFH11DRAFT_1725167 [Phellopilus nigrolimitatus]|nr:hypothetical protein DFH11DRAFT_1725167 [Phellopilus nigrolimitatus]